MRARLAVVAALLSAIVCIAHGISVVNVKATKNIIALYQPIVDTQRLAPLTADVSLVTELNSQIASVRNDKWARISNQCSIVMVGNTVVLDNQSSIALAPASGLKLVTASALIDKLGTDKRFDTIVSAAAPVAGQVANDLFISGGGDPLVMTDNFAAHLPVDSAAHTSIEQLAAKIKRSGVTQVLGRIGVDDSRYDDERINKNWRASLSPSQVAPISPLMVNGNRTDDNKPETDDPAIVFGTRLKEALINQGVPVAGDVVKEPVQSGLVEVAKQSSLPLSDIVGEMLRNSDNTSAEMMVKELAIADKQTPTTAQGLRVVAQWLDAQKLDKSGYVQLDGSGLADGDRVSCRLLEQLLTLNVANILDDLPVAAKSGTLRDRLGGTAAQNVIHAKTGTLGTASSLSGFINIIGGPKVMFAGIANGFANSIEARRWQDDLAVAIAAAQAPYTASLTEK